MKLNHVTQNRKNTGKIQSRLTYHIITRQELLKKLSLFVLNCFDDELVIASYKKQGPTGTWVG